MKRLILGLVAACMLLAPSLALAQAAQKPPSIPTITIQQPPATFDAPVAAPVVTVAQPKEAVAFGDYAGSLLSWLAVVLGPVLAMVAGDWYVKLRKRMGLETTEAQRSKFQEIVENGVGLGAHDARANLSGKLSFDVKNQIMASAVGYAKAHGAETLKALGADPTSPEAEEAIRARVAKILSDKEAVATAVEAGVQPQPPAPAVKT